MKQDGVWMSWAGLMLVKKGHYDAIVAQRDYHRKMADSMSTMLIQPGMQFRNEEIRAAAREDAHKWLDHMRSEQQARGDNIAPSLDSSTIHHEVPDASLPEKP